MSDSPLTTDPLDQDLPAREEWLPAHTAYTAVRSARLNSAIVLRLSELLEEELRSFHRDGEVLFDVRAVASDRIEPECIVLLVAGRRSAVAGAPGNTAPGFTAIPILKGIECFSQYERRDLGMNCRAVPLEQLTRFELLQLYASFLSRAVPLEALDDEWSRVFKLQH